jgi:hypothetical protein
MASSIKKPEAIARINRLYGQGGLDDRNTHFANVNARKDVWWLDIPLSKISRAGITEINLVLYDQHSDKLHFLRVPIDYMRANLGRLVVREDKAVISLELAADQTRLFQDVRPTSGGVQFGQFKQ